MAKLSIEVGIKKTEALSVMLEMKDDISELIDMVPDYCVEKRQLVENLETKWKHMSKLVEKVT